MCGDWVANANPCDCCATGNDLNLFFYILMKILLVSILVMLCFMKLARKPTV
jgi:hypothetical protein